MSDNEIGGKPRYACSRCAHRQAEDAVCGKCENDVVQDLHEMRSRHYLMDVDSREASARHSLNIKIGAAVGVAIFFVGFALTGSFKISTREVAVASFASALGVVALLEKVFGRPAKFPYLDDYE